MKTSRQWSSIRFVVVGIALLVLSGCGFTFKGSGSALPPDVKRVHIPIAENNTPEPGLSQWVTGALRDRFERYGVLTIVDKPSKADAVLRSRVLQLKRDTQTVTSSTDTALQERSVLVIAADLKRTNGVVLWSNPAMSVSKAYGTSDSVVVTSSPDFAGGNIGAQDLAGLSDREIQRGQEQDALQDLAEEAARRIYDEAVTPEF